MSRSSSNWALLRSLNLVRPIHQSTVDDGLRSNGPHDPHNFPSVFRRHLMWRIEPNHGGTVAAQQFPDLRNGQCAKIFVKVAFLCRIPRAACHRAARVVPVLGFE